MDATESAVVADEFAFTCGMNMMRGKLVVEPK